MRNSRQRAEVGPGFLVRIAPRDLLRALTVLDDASDRLDHPGFVTGRERSGTKLLNQNHRVENWVVGQDGDRVPAFENLALDRPTPAAAKQAMSVFVAIDAEVALKESLVAVYDDVAAAERALGITRLRLHRKPPHQGQAAGRS